jgi:hypothetical protein
VLGTAGLVLLVAGCGQQRPANGDVAPERGEISMVVQNNHWNDITLYLVHEGVSDRVGVVTAASTRSFVLPLRRFGTAGTFRLSAYQIGGDQYHVTELLPVQRDEHVTYTLESDLQRSSVTVH